MSLRQVALAAPLLAGVTALVASCDSGEGSGADLQAATFPLFPDFTEEEYNQSCSEFRREVIKSDGESHTETADVVDFKDVHEAIAHAKKVDKPIFLMTFVRENGDPACDV